MKGSVRIWILKKCSLNSAGRNGATVKEKGGSMHIANLELGSLGANGIVGGGIPLAVGAALTQQYKNRDNITVCFFGDGASNEGAFHESLNLSSVWDLPVLWVCTNNKYGLSNHISEGMNITDISIRAKSYGMKAVSLDGSDVIKVYEETLKAKEYVKKNGPMLMVLNTYRWMGHSKVDPQVYRSKEDLEEARSHDPIKTHEEFILKNKICTKKEMEALVAKADADIQEAYDFAEESPFPSIENIFEDVYAD